MSGHFAMWFASRQSGPVVFVVPPARACVNEVLTTGDN